jgi:ribosomal protein L37E
MNITVTDEDIQAIEDVARATVRWPDRRRWDSSEKDARFKSLFGASSLIIAEIWHRIEETVSLEDRNAERKHLLWALVFLKVYATEEIHCAIVGWPNAETFRKYSWYFINKIFQLEEKVIVWHSI